MKHATTLLAALIVLLSHAPARADDARPPAAKEESAVKEALDKAADIFDTMAKAGDKAGNDEAGKQFVKVLQSVALKFKRISFGEEAGKASWSAVILNTTGSGLDCIRIHTPKGEQRDMAWSFHCKRDRLVAWYIFPAAGEPAGFTNFFSLDPAQVKGVAIPDNDSIILQSLPAANLKADTDYIIYFKFDGKPKITVDMAINLLPKGTVENKAEPIATALGLTLKRDGN